MWVTHKLSLSAQVKKQSDCIEVKAYGKLQGTVGTLGSGIFGVFNRDVKDLGDIQSVNTSRTTGTTAKNALLNNYQDGYCYIPISGINGYKASDEGYDANIPVSQGITQMQTKSNIAIILWTRPQTWHL